MRCGGSSRRWGWRPSRRRAARPRHLTWRRSRPPSAPPSPSVRGPGGAGSEPHLTDLPSPCRAVGRNNSIRPSGRMVIHMMQAPSTGCPMIGPSGWRGPSELIRTAPAGRAHGEDATHEVGDVLVQLPLEVALVDDEQVSGAGEFHPHARGADRSGRGGHLCGSEVKGTGHPAGGMAVTGRGAEWESGRSGASDVRPPSPAVPATLGGWPSACSSSGGLTGRGHTPRVSHLPKPRSAYLDPDLVRRVMALMAE